VRDDLVGDGDLATHGVEVASAPFELFCLGDMIQQVRDGGDLVGPLVNRELRQRQSRVGGVRRLRVQGLGRTNQRCRGTQKPLPMGRAAERRVPSGANVAGRKNAYCKIRRPRD
jgi:hypothetical protein